MKNVDSQVVADFGREWQRFNQQSASPEELQALFMAYFKVFPWEALPAGAEGADIGCGSGRWARFVAPRVARLHCIDPSPAALEVARQNLAPYPNVSLILGSAGELPFPDNSLDFAYSLGVLHHVPDTAGALREIARVLKPGAPFLVYLYYAFDNRPFWFRLLWRITDLLRRGIARLPYWLKYLIAEGLALLVYWPLARTARLLEKVGKLPSHFPLAQYRHRSFYIMRNDALDRFGTRLEKRYTRQAIQTLLEEAGFTRIGFSDEEPFWCAVAYKRPTLSSTSTS
ncbi:MAG: class I SAM-dependent methyltransferase [Bacteroidetes bacterium]|nr:MAG: class I SAM-dependent methyltransferase [Bacteroidota bacterium]